jgi:L-arabinose isomerase
MLAHIPSPVYPFFAAANLTAIVSTETDSTTTTINLGTAVNMYTIGGFTFAAGASSQF